MQKRKRTPLQIVSVGLLAILSGAFVVASPASASPASWSTQLDDVGSETVLTHPSGDVSVGQISGSGPSAVQTLPLAGDSALSVAMSVSPQVAPNAFMWAVGVDNTVYALAMQPIGAGVQTHVVAYDGSTKVWDIVPPDTCSGQFEGVQGLKMGADGNVYIVSYRSSGCGGQEFFLSAIDHTDGSTVFSVSLGSNFSVAPSNLFTYSSGVAVLSANVLRYYGAAGVLLSQTTISLTSGEWIGWATATYAGRVYVLVNKNRSVTEACPYPWTSVSDRLLAFEPDGVVEDGDSNDLHYNVQDCAIVYPMATPDGGAVIVVRSYGTEDKLVSLDDSLDEVWDAAFDLGVIAGREFVAGSSHDVLVDNNGNILTITPYTRQSQMYHDTQISVLSGVTGARKSVFYSDQLSTTSSFSVTTNGIGLAQNTLYVTAHVCSSGQCSSSDAFHLYALPVVGLGMDYPRARVLGQSPVSQTSLKYAALGDSYSAGESVEPFISPSDSDGCHRSTQAYAKLLDEDPALNLDLQAFVACSGATTASIEGDSNGEGSQLDALSTDDDVVTITVGGNDIGFVPFARSCFVEDCSISSEYSNSLDKITNTLPGSLEHLFEEIQERVGEDTRVLVVGYPRLMPYTMVQWPSCGYLSQDERSAVQNVTVGLNDALNEAASNAGSQFEFVDADIVDGGVLLSPFAGHELCGDDNYFNGIVTSPAGYSFHPNGQGQAAYETLIREYVRSSIA